MITAMKHSRIKIISAVSMITAMKHSRIKIMSVYTYNTELA